jgi:hypothetical protein
MAIKTHFQQPYVRWSKGFYHQTFSDNFFLIINLVATKKVFGHNPKIKPSHILTKTHSWLQYIRWSNFLIATRLVTKNFWSPNLWL